MQNKIKYCFKNTPPTEFNIYERAQKKFGVDFYKGVVFAVGQNIHCLYELPADYLEHEKTHLRQQAKIGVEKWWDKYFEDDQFRFKQELEAYRAQYQYMKKREPNKNIVFKNLQKYATDLSSTIYGNICSLDEAILSIKK